MRQQYALYWLVPLVVMLALVAAGVGLFYQEGGSSFAFTTVRGETVQIWGQGWYKFDSPIAALSFIAADLITLFLGIPLLVLSSLLYRRNSVRGGLLLTGALAYLLYNYTSVGFGAAYNDLFLVYVILFSASLFGLVLALSAFDCSLYGGSATPWYGNLPGQLGRYPESGLAGVVDHPCLASQ
jgi:hypothetical protein